MKVLFHPSQFPAAVRAELLRCLRERAINHKFHYDSYKQVQQWLALHDACSPARTDPNCAAVYDSAFETVAALDAPSVHLIGLGCGGGQKDLRLLQLLSARERKLSYTPVDVSGPMVLTAALAIKPLIAESIPLVCALQLAHDLSALINEHCPTAGARLVTFFRMNPNFEPDTILPRLAELLRPNDLLLFSANLAPGPDYRRGVERIQPLYDNDLTRD